MQTHFRIPLATTTLTPSLVWILQLKMQLHPEKPNPCSTQ